MIPFTDIKNIDQKLESVGLDTAKLRNIESRTS